MSDERRIKISFSNKEKLFDEIADLFYKQNFGTASKSDIDLLMFKIYIEELIEQNKDNDKDNTIDYNKISDYKIARHLGITPQKVRSLKLKKELVYPQKDFEWKYSLRRLLSDERRIRIDNNSIKISIPDPCLFLRIQEHIEEHSGYVDIQLNNKLLVVPISDFLDLVNLVCTEDEYRTIENTISDIYNTSIKNPDNTKDIYDKLKAISEFAKNTTEAITNIVLLFQPTGMAIKTIKTIIELIGRR